MSLTVDPSVAKTDPAVLEPAGNTLAAEERAATHSSTSNSPADQLRAAQNESVPVMGRTASGGFVTNEGTIYVSKPFRTPGSKGKKMGAMVKFAPRTSAFDISNERSVTNEFRGFFTLFWISMFLLALGSFVRSFETSGVFLDLIFARNFSQDAITLAISDAVLVLSTGFCVLLIKAVQKKWIPFYWTGAVIQHTFQTLVLACVVTWTFNRQWPWVQSGFLTLHSLVMIMKMHSYVSTNGYLSSVHAQLSRTKSKLEKATTEVGGYEKALAEAETRRNTVLSASAASTPDAVSTPGHDAPVQTYMDAGAAATLRQRLTAAAARPNGNGSATEGLPAVRVEDEAGHETEIIAPKEVRKAPEPHPLMNHPDERVAALAREYSELEAELVSSGPEYVRWPENVGWKNFAVYQLIPTLVYELEYPRTNRIRPLYVFEKTVATFGTFALLYTVTERFILPLTPTAEQSFARSLLDLALPFMVAYLLLFYLIFECICNGFAELSYFADRQFYEDWWNSTSWDDFSRKWNKPVHAFLLRHVYASTITTYKLSRTSAMFVTFLLSAAVHELVMVIVTKKFRMYLFALQIIQIPLIAVGRIPAIKRNKLMGNIVFWLGLYAGFPLLCVAYCAY